MADGGESGRRRKVPRTPDAVDVALDGASDDVATHLLEKHGRLIDAQIKSERLDHGAKRTLIAVRLAIGLVALLVAGALAWMVADARADHGLVIEALSVPPDLAQRGLTGETLAANLSDRLADIDRKAQSFRSPETMQVNWGNDIKIEIPSTGISIDELDRYLHRKLGKQTVIGGAVFREPAGLRLTVRTGALGTIEQTGTDANLEAMVQKAAEGVFQQTQAYRYSKYLEFSGRKDEAMAVARTLAETSDDPKERAWAWAQISNLLETVDTRRAVATGLRAIQEDPANPLAYLNTCIALSELAHDGEAAPICEKAAQLGSQRAGGLSEIGVNTSRSNLIAKSANKGDFATALRQSQAINGQEYAGVAEANQAAISGLLTAMHDVSGSRRVGGSPTDAWLAAHFIGSGGLRTPQINRAITLADWPRAISLLQQISAVVDKQPEGPAVAKVERERSLLPLYAGVLAQAGRSQEAQKMAASLPADCVGCNLAKGAIAGISGDYRTAEHFIGLVDIALPTAPFADTTMSQIFFKAHRYQDALDYAARATGRGPHYADALKVRGDALRKLGRVDEADGYYAEAEAAAPRWGRLQIDRAVADYRLGRANKARERLARAARLDLSAGDKLVVRRLQALMKA